MIARSGLPEPLGPLVASIARRTWLGRRERAEAARELVDRCRQALDEGRTVEQVAESLGTPAAAARDLRRRLIARRSWIGRNVPVAVRLATIAIVAFVGTYLGIAVLDWRQGPNVTTDFVANLNAGIDASTPEERGWPRLREGLTTWRGLVEPESTFDAGITDPIARSRMLSRLSTQAQGILPSWTGMARTPDLDADAIPEDAVDAFFDSMEPGRKLVLDAAGRPILGFEIATGTASDPADRLFLGLPDPLPTAGPTASPTSGPNGPLLDSVISIQLPFLNSVRAAARVLDADARRAIVEGDGRRAVEDLGGVFGLGRLVRHPPFLISQLVGFAIDSLALSTIQDALAVAPEAFTDEDLRVLLEVLESMDDSSFVLDLSVERLTFLDIAQRIYTDDGDGDGRITFEGLATIGGLTGVGTGAGTGAGVDGVLDGPAVARFLLGPMVSRMMLSRAEATRIWNQMFEGYEAAAAMPAWEVDRDELLRFDGRLIAEMTAGRTEMFRYFPINLLLPALDKAVLAGHALRADRDLAAMIVALELERRSAGGWPATLPEASRAIDPFTGDLLHYALRDGRPTIWSVGIDRDDDGGRERVPARPGSRAARNAHRIGAFVKHWGRVDPTGEFDDPANDGDLVIWRGEGAPQSP